MVAALDEGRLLERYPVEADGAHPAIRRRRPVAAAWSLRCLSHEKSKSKLYEIEGRTTQADRADPGRTGLPGRGTHLAEGDAGADGDRTLGGGRRGGGGHGGGDRGEGGDRAGASGVGR